MHKDLNIGNNTDKMISGFEKKDTQCVKGIGIIMMIIHHCFLEPARYEGQTVIFDPFSESLLNYIALSLKICVALFTFLSAYGMTISYGNKYSGLSLKAPDYYQVLLKRLITLVMNFVFIFIFVQLYDVIVVQDDRYHLVYGKGLKSVLYFIVDGLGLSEMFGFPTYLATFWYMSLAILCILLLPILISFYKRFGAIPLLSVSMLLAVLFPVTSENHYAYLPRYLFCICLGVVCADHNLIAKITDAKILGNRLDGIIKLILFCGICLLSLYFRQETRDTALLPFWDGVIPLFGCAIVKGFINKIPGINIGLQFLGKHSMNIFLIHNFIRIVWYYDFTYSFKKWWLIVLVLLGLSLVISIVLEFTKKLLRYNKMTAKLAGITTDKFAVKEH